MHAIDQETSREYIAIYRMKFNAEETKVMEKDVAELTEIKCNNMPLSIVNNLQYQRSIISESGSKP